jgi:hypothetical protein
MAGALRQGRPRCAPGRGAVYPFDPEKRHTKRISGHHRIEQRIPGGTVTPIKPKGRVVVPEVLGGPTTTIAEPLEPLLWSDEPGSPYGHCEQATPTVRATLEVLAAESQGSSKPGDDGVLCWSSCLVSSQKPPVARAYEFKSRFRHQRGR